MKLTAPLTKACFIIIVLAGSVNRSGASDTDTSIAPTPTFVPRKSYDAPKEMLYTGKRENDEYPGPLYPRFYPIGWSKDGKYAYAVEAPDEACGCYFLDIYIQDMVTDKTVWKWTLKLEEGDGYDFDKGNDHYRLLNWKKNNKLFTQKLNLYKIEPVDINPLLKFPITSAGHQYNFAITNKMIESEDYGMKMLASTIVSLVTDGKTIKTVFTEKYTSKQEGSDNPNFTTTISNKILGYCKSPYQNRVAIFYTTEVRGWEGPPNVIGLGFIGCSIPGLAQ